VAHGLPQSREMKLGEIISKPNWPCGELKESAVEREWSNLLGFLCNGRFP